MEFNSSDKNRLRIINKRYNYEQKWWGFRCSVRMLRIVSICIISISLYRYIYNIGNQAVNLIYVCMSIPAGVLIPFFLKLIARSVMASWVTDIFSEKLEIRDGVIHREYSLSLGVGYMNLLEGNDRVIMTTKLADIHDLKMCKMTGRIQFNATTRIQYYNDWKNKVIDQDYVKIDFLNVYYDYFEPSLMEYLKESGIPYIEGDMKFKKGK